MIKGFLNYFKAPPILPVTEPKEVIDKQYKNKPIVAINISL